MPYRFLTIFLIFFVSLSANATPKYNTLAKYSKITDNSKILIQFEFGVSEKEQIKLIKNLPQAYSHYFIPAPDLAIINTRCQTTGAYYGFVESLEQLPEVKYAGLYCHNGQGMSFGILNQVFVKLKSSYDLPVLESIIRWFTR